MKSKEFREKLEQILEDTVVSKIYVSVQCDHTYCIELEYWSKLGEDVIISSVIDKLTLDALAHELFDTLQNFDADEHAVQLYNLAGDGGTPTDLRSLLDDAEEQEKELENIFIAVSKAVDNG